MKKYISSSMTEKTGSGKITIKTSGKGYENYWIYVPSSIAKDPSFPFKKPEKVKIELKNGKLIISKENYLMELIHGHGIENLTLPRILEDKAQKNGDKPLILYKDECYSYQEVNERSNEVANGLLKLRKFLELKRSKSPKKRTKIAVMLPNIPEFFFCWFGIIKSGFMFVPINWFLKGNDLIYNKKKSDAEILIIDHRVFKVIEEIKED